MKPEKPKKQSNDGETKNNKKANKQKQREESLIKKGL